MKKAGLRRIIFMGAVGIYDEIPADMDDEDNVRNNPDQIPNRKAADIVEKALEAWFRKEEADIVQ